MTLRCSRCRIAKPATREFFHHRRENNSGLTSQCKSCRHASSAAYRLRRNGPRRPALTGAARAKRYRERLRATARRVDTGAPPREARWRLQNQHHVRAYFRAYRKLKPDVVRAANRNNKAKRRQAEGRHTAADVARQLDAQSGRCFWCPRLVGTIYHVDHFVPLTKGGSNWPSNIVIACPDCNLRKGAKLPDEWRRKGVDTTQR